MIKDLVKTNGMSNKEIMYVVASEWIDEICFKVVEDADEIMSNPIVDSMIRQAAEQILRYGEKRKAIALGELKSDDFWYETGRVDVRAYKTVLYDNLFSKYGANTHDV